jgi:Domain of unknown function (DUF1906)/FG-GAP-like repeat
MTRIIFVFCLSIALLVTVSAQSSIEKPSSQIENIQTFGKSSGVAYTNDTIFRTDDNGENWRQLTLPTGLFDKIVGIEFADENNGVVVLGGNNLSLLKTIDGGNTWIRNKIILRSEDFSEVDLQEISIDLEDGLKGQILLAFRLPTSSNFTGRVFYESLDGGASWQFINRTIVLRENDDVSVKRTNRWTLENDGNCIYDKTFCVSEAKIFRGNVEITPPQIKSSGEIVFNEPQKSIFPPNGSTRISLNRGFDKCTAATVAQMQTWWNNSPFYDVNIYHSGRNRGCSQAQLTASWVNSVTNQGWGLIPTVVGYQSPCSVCTTCAKHSTDAVVAETQGRGEADIAINDANNLGITTGSILYYDMERYDDLSGTGACSTPTKAFLKGWTDRMKELGYKSGVYGSPTNAMGDWINIPTASQPDAIWMARWNNVMSVWSIAPVTDGFWNNHQRIHQWLGPRDETWGGVTFNIDNNISDAPVAALQVPRNKKADFDGDGKTDISVFRPNDGVWHILNSSSGVYSPFGFGTLGDVLTPGDFDGDGKTDYAIFRPSTGTWYSYSRSILTVRQFGASGDIPTAADFDGDGRTDIAVYRPTTGVWYILNSFDSRGTSTTILQFGLNGDNPVAGDYDLDGKADIAVFRPSSGLWYLNQSTQGFSVVQFGLNGDIPVQDDYDGDGKTDVAVFRPSNGVWYLNRSSLGFTAFQFGISTDIPTEGDFNGDGKADAAVYRDGVWYVYFLQSNTFSVNVFGLATDLPVPNAYN